MEAGCGRDDSSGGGSGAVGGVPYLGRLLNGAKKDNGGLSFTMAKSGIAKAAFTRKVLFSAVFG